MIGHPWHLSFHEKVKQLIKTTSQKSKLENKKRCFVIASSMAKKLSKNFVYSSKCSLVIIVKNAQSSIIKNMLLALKLL